MKILSLVLLLLGVYIGAGVASGQEILCYFAKYGFLCIPFAILIGVAFVLFINMSYKLAIKFDCQSINEFNKIVFPKSHKFISCFYCISLIIIIGGMLSGNLQIGHILFSKNYYIFQIITIIFAFIIITGGIKRITKISTFLVPIILILIAYIFFKSMPSFAVGNININSNIFFSFTSLINYFFINILFITMFIFSVSKNYSLKEIKISSMISGIVITFIIIIISLILIFTNSFLYTMPLVYISFNIHKTLGIVSCIVVWLGLLTTLITDMFTLQNEIKVIKNIFLKYILILLIGVLLSLINFKFIIEWIYLIISIFSMFYYINVFIKLKYNECFNKIYFDNRSKIKS